MTDAFDPSPFQQLSPLVDDHCGQDAGRGGLGSARFYCKGAAMTARWHFVKDGDSVTLCRQCPPRFDFVVHTVLPKGQPKRLAHQIRQDLWRALQHLRGFSPVVRLEPVSAGWAVSAGGRAMGHVASATLDRASAVLDDTDNRKRWMRHARGDHT